MTVVNKTTLRVIYSANTPEYSTDDWFHNPSIPDCVNKYWKLVDGDIVEMSTTEKTAIDDAINATMTEFNLRQD